MTESDDEGPEGPCLLAGLFILIGCIWGFSPITGGGPWKADFDPLGDRGWGPIVLFGIAGILAIVASCIFIRKIGE